MAELRPDMPDELSQMIQNIEDPRQLTYAVATYMRMDMSDAQQLLEMEGLPNKMLFLLQLLNKELEVLQLGQEDPGGGAERDGEGAARISFCASKSKPSKENWARPTSNNRSLEVPREDRGQPA